MSLGRAFCCPEREGSTERATLTSLITRLRDRIAGDGGFTLLETLAVMVIVGLLAAITIPQISKWREKAYVTGLKTDARTLALAIEASYVDAQMYPHQSEIQDQVPSSAVIAAYALIDTSGADTGQATATGFRFNLVSTKGAAPMIEWNSQDGGLQ